MALLPPRHRDVLRALALIVVAGCGREDDSTGSSLEGADAGLEPAPACGPAPHARVRLATRNVASAESAPAGVPGTTVTFKHCPGVTVTTDDDGRALVDITAGVETWVRFDAKGFLPWLMGETVTGPATSGVTATMIPESGAATLIPGYWSDWPTIYVQVQAGRTSDPPACRTKEGVALAVKEQPGATVTYRSATAPNAYAPGPATTTDGWALITKVLETPAGVTVVGTKPGCTYAAAYNASDGGGLVPIVRTPLQSGAVTVVFLTPAR